MKPSESQFQNAKDAQETTRHVITKFPALLTAQSLDKLNKTEGYEFPFSGDEIAKIKAEKKQK